MDESNMMGGLPVSSPVTGGDWMEKALNALVQVQTARYAAKFAGSVANQYTAGAAIPQDGNPNAYTQSPGQWATAAPAGASFGLSLGNDALLFAAILAGVVVFAVALD